MPIMQAGRSMVAWWPLQGGLCLRAALLTLGTISQKPLRKDCVCARMAVVMRCSATKSTYSRLFSLVTCSTAQHHVRTCQSAANKF